MSAIPGDPAAGSYDQDGDLPPVPPLAEADGGAPGWRSWWVPVAILWGRSQRPAAGLLAWTVLAALPAAGVIALVAQAFEQRVGRGNPQNSLPWDVGLIAAAPFLLPLVIAGGYLIARAWMGAAWITALRAAGQPAHPGQAMAAGRRRSLALWAAYLGGVVALCLVAGLAGDLLANDQLVRAVLVSVGPLGLLGPLVLLAPSRIYAGQATASGRAARPARRGRLATLTVVVLACQLGIGVALSPLVDLARVPGTLGVLVAFVLSIPSTLLLAAAGQASYAARHTCGC